MPTLRIHNNNENMIHFLTITVIEWIDIFTKPEYSEVIISSLKYCSENKGLLIYEYIIMTNHLHMIISTKEGFDLSQVISDFKKFTTTEICKLLLKDNRKYILSLLNNSFHKKEGSKMQIWQRENYPEVIETERFYMSKVKYIHDNPVRKGYVEFPEHWVYSSANKHQALRLHSPIGTIEPA